MAKCNQSTSLSFRGLNIFFFNLCYNLVVVWCCLLVPVKWLVGKIISEMTHSVLSRTLNSTVSAHWSATQPGVARTWGTGTPLDVWNFTSQFRVVGKTGRSGWIWQSDRGSQFCHGGGLNPSIKFSPSIVLEIYWLTVRMDSEVPISALKWMCPYLFVFRCLWPQRCRKWWSAGACATPSVTEGKPCAPICSDALWRC